MSVSKKSLFSLQDKIVNEIQNKIESKALKVGELIPSEDEIGKKYGVSRVTVRLALNKLEEELTNEKVVNSVGGMAAAAVHELSLIHISEPTRPERI